MADITTATVAPFVQKTWRSPSRSEFTGVPLGEIIFQGSQVVPLKINTNQSMWTLQCNFPRNWVYRVVEFRVWAFADATAWATQLAATMSCLVSSDADDEDDWYFMLANQGYKGGQAGANWYEFQFESADPAFWLNYLPVGPIDAPINTGKGAARLFLRWMDRNNAETVSYKAWFRIRALRYDISQADQWPMHTASPTIGP